MSDKIGKLEVSESLWTKLMNLISTARVLILCLSIGKLMYSCVSVEQLAPVQLDSFEIGEPKQ